MEGEGPTNGYGCSEIPRIRVLSPPTDNASDAPRTLRNNSRKNLLCRAGRTIRFMTRALPGSSR